MNFGMLIGTTDSHFSIQTVTRKTAPLVEGKGCQSLGSKVFFGPHKDHQMEDHLAAKGYLGNIEYKGEGVPKDYLAYHSG